MKKYYLFSLIAILFNGNLIAQNNCDTSLIQANIQIREHLLSEDFSKYTNHKFSELLKNDTLKNYCHYITMGTYPGCLPGVTLTYTIYDMRLRVYFQETCPNGKTFKRKGRWSKSKIYKNATISKIEVDDLLLPF